MELTCCHGNHYDIRISLIVSANKRVTKKLNFVCLICTVFCDFGETVFCEALHFDRGK